MRILIVEDNDPIADLVRLQLERGVPAVNEVRRDSDGETAIDVCREFDPTVVVMDHGLPGISADETAEGIRALRPHVVLLSFSGGPEDEKPWADATLAKGPGGFRRLAETVVEIAQRRSG